MSKDFVNIPEGNHTTEGANENARAALKDYVKTKDSLVPMIATVIIIALILVSFIACASDMLLTR